MSSTFLFSFSPSLIAFLLYNFSLHSKQSIPITFIFSSPFHLFSPLSIDFYPRVYIYSSFHTHTHTHTQTYTIISSKTHSLSIYQSVYLSISIYLCVSRLIVSHILTRILLSSLSQTREPLVCVQEGSVRTASASMKTFIAISPEIVLTERTNWGVVSICMCVCVCVS